MAVRMELARILIRELAEFQLIELKEVADDAADIENRRSFPIVIGLPEAQAIDRRLKGIKVQRPQTHDLLATVVSQLGAELISVSVTDLQDHTFFATLDIRTDDGETLHVDARPSDAIALGVAEQVPILVAEHVIDGATNEDTPE